MGVKMLRSQVSNCVGFLVRGPIRLQGISGKSSHSDRFSIIGLFTLLV